MPTSSLMQEAEVPAGCDAAALAALLRDATGAEPWARVQLAGTGAVAAVEARLAALLERESVLLLSSCTTGLIAAALALHLNGKEVITTPLSYAATLTGVLLAGARPVFADVDPVTLTLDPEAVRRAITPRTGAILAVDYLGVPADAAALRRVADDHGLPLLLDAAQSLGAARAGRPAGQAATVAVSSFTVEKALAAGEGGALATDDRALFEAVVAWTQHPSRQARERGFGAVSALGLNGRIHPLAALWLEAALDGALARLYARQRRTLALVDALNATGLTAPLPYTWEGIRPAGCRLPVRWAGAPRPERLGAALVTAGFAVHLDQTPWRLLPDDRGVRARFGRRLRLADGLPVARAAARQGFGVVVAG